MNSAVAESTAAFSAAELDELIIGRELAHPLCDHRGRVLVDAGRALTSDEKRRLKQEGVVRVRLHADDLARLTFRDETTESTEFLPLGNEATRQLDEIVDAGMLDVVNRGPAASEQMAVHGPSRYDPLHRDYLQKQHLAGEETLNAVLRDAVAGQRPGSETVTRLASNFLRAMADDADCVLSVAADTDRRSIAEHSLRMALLGMAIGVEMGLDSENVRRIGMAGLVHDLGMARVPEAIRQSPQRLTRTEFLEVTKHPMYTLELLERTPGLSSQVMLAAYQVHERPNGTGYPRGRTGERIHPFARILHVADMYCALTAARPYRRPLMPYAAMECVLSLAKERVVDPAVVRVLLHVLSLFPIGSFVQLSDRSLARVLRSNRASYWAPVVQLVQTKDGQVVPADASDAIVDLSITDLRVTQALPTPGRGEIALTREIIVHHGC
jgi:HD-GYP domain-containing protein (c-di-GMP phosphodiesterase class II)